MSIKPSQTKAAMETVVMLVLSNDSPSNYDDADAVTESVQSEIEADYFEVDDMESSHIAEICEDWYNSEDQDEEEDEGE